MNCALLGCYAANSGNCLPVFRYNYRFTLQASRILNRSLKSRMGKACGTYGDEGNVYRDLVRKSKGKRRLWKSRSRWEESIKMNKYLIKDHWGDKNVDGRIIFGWIFRKWEGVVGTRWGWFKIGTGGGRL